MIKVTLRNFKAIFILTKESIDMIWEDISVEG